MRRLQLGKPALCECCDEAGRRLVFRALINALNAFRCD